MWWTSTPYLWCTTATKRQTIVKKWRNVRNLLMAWRNLFQIIRPFTIKSHKMQYFVLLPLNNQVTKVKKTKVRKKISTNKLNSHLLIKKKVGTNSTTKAKDAFERNGKKLKQYK